MALRPRVRGALAFAFVLSLLAVLITVLPVDARRADSPAPPLEAAEALQAGVPRTQEELGAMLFFDPKLSGDISTSCATCHIPEQAYTDGVALSAGYTSTLYFRNTPTLLNVGDLLVLDWDARFAGSDLSSAIRDHLAEAHFMNVDGRLMVERLRQVPEYEEGFNAAFGGGEPTYGRTLDALAAFIRTLSSTNNPYVDFMAGDVSALSSAAQEGLALFEGRAGCAQCHSGPLLSDGELHVLGVAENADIFDEPLRHITFRRFFRAFGVSEYVTLREDPGFFALTHDEADRGAFRTPSLLEVARTAPYMHNGVFGSLEDIVRFYNDGGGDAANKDDSLVALDLSEAEIAALVTFLASLASDDDPIDAVEPPSYQLRTLGEN